MSASHYPNQFTWMPFPRKYLWYQYVIWVYIYIYIFFLQHPGILLCQVKEYHARISHIIPLFVTKIILRLRFHCKCRPSNLSEISIFIPPASTKLIGGYTGITLSVCPSVDRIVSALYLQEYSSSNFRRCVVCNAHFKIQKFKILSNFLNL